MTLDDKELDYAKIRDAMDLANEKLREKEEKDKKNTIKEQEKSQEQLNKEKKDKIFKWIAYGGIILIAVVIFIIILYLIFGYSSSPSTVQNIKPQMQPPPIRQPQMPQMQPPPMQPPQMPQMQPPPMPQMQPPPMPQPFQLFPAQQETSMPMQRPTTSSYDQSFSFPSNNSSFFNKFDGLSSTPQQPIKRGGWSKKK